jgi:glutaredoxin
MDQRKVVLYTRSHSPRCWHAKRLLRHGGYQFKVIDTTNDPEARAWLLGFTHQKTVEPYVFIDERPVGDFKTVRALARSGQLDHLVRDALWVGTRLPTGSGYP